MKILTDLFAIAVAVLVFATAIFHPACVIAFASVAGAYHLGQIREAIVSFAIRYSAGPK